jgi:hypothetical protein
MEEELESEVEEVVVVKEKVIVEMTDEQSESVEVMSIATLEPEEESIDLDLDLERRPSNYTPAPQRAKKCTPPHPTLPLPLGDEGFAWKRASIALSCSSLFTDEFDTPLSTPRLSGFGSGSSSSGTDEMECSTPQSELAELPLSPEYLPVDGKRRASLAFPSRMGASCISLGRY